MLSEEDKRKVFMGLKEKRQDLFLQLNKLPMSSNTIGAREHKSKIEQEIDEIEAAIKMFQEKGSRGVYLNEIGELQFLWIYAFIKLLII